MRKVNVMLGHYFKKHFLETFYEKRKKKKQLLFLIAYYIPMKLALKLF